MIIFRQVITASVIVIVAVVICFFSGKAITKISTSLQKKQELSELLALRVDNIQRLKNSLKLLGDTDQKIIGVYPSTDNILDFVGALNSLAKQNALKQGLRFGNFMPVTEAGGISIDKTDYSIELNGSIGTLKNYLTQLEKISFVTKIGAVNLLAAPPDGWNSNSTITIIGSLYAQQTK